MVEVPRQLLRNHGYLDKHVDVELPRRTRAIKVFDVGRHRLGGGGLRHHGDGFD